MLRMLQPNLGDTERGVQCLRGCAAALDSSQAAFQTANVSSRITISVSRSNSNSASILRSSHLPCRHALVSLFPYHYWSANQHTSACLQRKRLLLRMEAQQSYYSPMPKAATTWNRAATTWNIAFDDKIEGDWITETEDMFSCLLMFDSQKKKVLVFTSSPRSKYLHRNIYERCAHPNHVKKAHSNLNENVLFSFKNFPH